MVEPHLRPALFLAVIAVALLSSIPAFRLAHRLLQADDAPEPLPVSSYESYTLLIAPVAGYVLLGMLAGEIELLDWRHILTVWGYTGLAIAAYLIARTRRHTAGPLLLALLPAALGTGVVLFLVELVHFYEFIGLGLMLLASPGFLLAVLVAPAFALMPAAILLATELYLMLRYNRRQLPGATSGLPRWLMAAYYGRYWVLTQVFTFPLFITVVQVVLLAAAQQPDSLAQVFLESKDGLFSQGSCENCTPSSGNSEYVCTIAGFGSPWLVRPLGWGRRQGHPIRVTRQLQVCNAFEEWLAQVAPPVQRCLRRWYDGLQISIERWRQVRPVANLLYVLLKPLEWSFLLVLYLAVRRPEANIARQYQPVPNPAIQA